MSRRRLLPLALVLLGLAVPARAQVATRGSDRLDSLLVELRTAEDLVRREADARRARLREGTAERLDTARVGPLLVVARAPQLARATRALTAAWERLGPLVGNARLPQLVLLVPPGGSAPAFAVMATRPHHFQVWIGGWGAAAERRATRELGRVLVSVLSPELRAWVGNASLGGIRLEDAYRQLATSPEPAAQECLAASPAACAVALGIGELQPDSLAARVARASFLVHLLRTQGPEGFGMLQDANGGVASQLGALAGGSNLEPGLRAWRARVVAARPRAEAGLARTTIAVLAWMALLLGLARRSTRWRFG